MKTFGTVSLFWINTYILKEEIMILRFFILCV